MGSVDHCILKPSCVLRCKGVRIVSIYQECLKSSPRRLQQVYVCEECIGICIYCCIVLSLSIYVYLFICLSVYMFICLYVYRIKLQVLKTCNMYKVWFRMF